MTEPFIIGMIVGTVFSIAVAAITFIVVMCFHFDTRLKRLEYLEAARNGDHEPPWKTTISS
jgi:hypothetical protein